MHTSPANESTPDPAAHLELGRRGEAWAAAYLAQQGYEIVAANFALPVGRNLRGAIVKAEIDLIAYDGPILCFIEVKTRASDHFAPPQANVDRRKRRQIARAARAYRRLFGRSDSLYRYDVVSVLLPPAPDSATPLEIEILKGFWKEKKKVMSEDSFRV